VIKDSRDRGGSRTPRLADDDLWPKGHVSDSWIVTWLFTWL